MKNALPVFGGVSGAVAGFVATLLALELGGFGNKADPITSGVLALAVFAPVGAIAGLMLGTKLAMRLRGGNDSEGLLANSFRAFAAVVVLVASAGGIYYWYAVATATP